MQRWRFVSVTVVVCLVLAAGSLAQQKAGPSEDDKQIRQKIVDALMLDQWLQGYMPKVAVEGGVITLTGTYKSEVQHKRVLAVVNRVASGKKVVDKMELAKS